MTSRWWLVVALLAGCPKKPASTGPEGGGTAGAGASAPQPVDASRSVEDRVNEAAELVEKGQPADLDHAVALLQSAVNEDSTGTARYNLALAELKRGNEDQARSQLQALVASDPKFGDAWLALGRLTAEDGDLRGALTSYQTGIQNDPENIGLRVAQIDALRQTGQPAQAVEAAKEALKVNSKAIGVYNAFGLACLDQKNLVLAKFVFQKAIQEIDGAEDDAGLQTNLGWTFYLDHNVPAATEHLQKALAIDPNLVPALVYLSRVYMDDHNYAATVPLLENAVSQEPKNADLQLTLGVAYRGVGRLDDAQKAYQKALTLNPSNPAPHFNLGVLLGDYRKDYDGAVSEFNAYVAANGPESELAQTYIKDVTKEKDIAAKRAAADAERKAKEEAKQKEEQQKEQQDTWGGTPGETPAPAPGGEPAPAPAPSDPTTPAPG